MIASEMKRKPILKTLLGVVSNRDARMCSRFTSVKRLRTNLRDYSGLTAIPVSLIQIVSRGVGWKKTPERAIAAASVRANRVSRAVNTGCFNTYKNLSMFRFLCAFDVRLRTAAAIAA